VQDMAIGCFTAPPVERIYSNKRNWKKNLGYSKQVLTPQCPLGDRGDMSILSRSCWSGFCLPQPRLLEIPTKILRVSAQHLMLSIHFHHCIYSDAPRPATLVQTFWFLLCYWRWWIS
jgi:hypothetical protein